jgi:hypothetical protein
MQSEAISPHNPTPMKTVFRSAELPHIYFHQRAPHGRAPSRMSFDGPIFKSYNAVLACIHPAHNVVLMNNRRYSNTTAKHQSYLRRAIPGHLTAIYGPSDFVANPANFVASLMDSANDAHSAATETKRDFPRRKSVIATNEAQCLRLLETAKRVSDVFGLGIQCTMEGIEEMRVAAEKSRLEREARMVAEQKRQAKRARENLKKWLAGEDVPTYSLPDGATYLRPYWLPDSSPIVQTSKGIEIPLAIAKESLAFVFSKRESGWKRNGETFEIVGYQLDSVTNDGIVAGCHRITWKELERLQTLLAPL